MKNVKMFVFDIDGVITDGKKYIDGKGTELKSVALKDLDALTTLKAVGCKIGCVSGEDTDFSRQLARMGVLDYVRLGCKEKPLALAEIKDLYGISSDEVCYIGDGKYDIAMLKMAGLSACPADAIEEVKAVSDLILKRRGGEGCIAELCTLLCRVQSEKTESDKRTYADIILKCGKSHRDVQEKLFGDGDILHHLETAVDMILHSYKDRGTVFFCGNGGSAADAQHLAAELVGRFYLERRGFHAEALTVNTSVLTSLANDYDYSHIFARQLEANAKEGDVLVGITTSGKSENILQAFRTAKEMGVKTILMTGEVPGHLPVIYYSDCVLAVPSKDTPRIQEMHILMGHIICEIVERELTKGRNTDG